MLFNCVTTAFDQLTLKRSLDHKMKILKLKYCVEWNAFRFLEVRSNNVSNEFELLKQVKECCRAVINKYRGEKGFGGSILTKNHQKERKS